MKRGEVLQTGEHTALKIRFNIKDCIGQPDVAHRFGQKEARGTRFSRNAQRGLVATLAGTVQHHVD